jgi:hypothetical protein
VIDFSMLDASATGCRLLVRVGKDRGGHTAFGHHETPKNPRVYHHTSPHFPIQMTSNDHNYSFSPEFSSTKNPNFHRECPSLLSPSMSNFELASFHIPGGEPSTQTIHMGKAAGLGLV